MAKMIPARIDDGYVSADERPVFGWRLLKNDPATATWCVFHSLGIACRPTGPYGEIDFVIIIPSESVICLEIKGGWGLCRVGMWRTMDRRGNVAALKKSLFLQARDVDVCPTQRDSPALWAVTAEAHCPIGYAVGLS